MFCIQWDSTWLTPRQLLVQDIADITNQWRESALRALQCNFDAIEVGVVLNFNLFFQTLNSL
jgi:2,4-dienoyl-CoA reductase-like NADH-dependent reductase (Old Yellow Enzyme family)